MLRTVLMIVFILAGADLVMFDGKYTAAAQHVAERVALYSGLK